MPLYVYFHAPDDSKALDTLGDPASAGFATLSVKGMEPSLQLSDGEAALLGVDSEELAEDPRACALLSDSEAESEWLVTLTDRLRDAVATATAEERVAAAAVWAGSPEFDPPAEPMQLADFLERLAALAVRARTDGSRLYCWIFV